MRNMVPFQAAWLEFYRVMHITVISLFRAHVRFGYCYSILVVPQICNYVLMNIIISSHNYL